MLFACVMFIIFANVFCFHALCWVVDTDYLLQILSCMVNSAFNLLVFLILCSHHFFNGRAIFFSGEIAHKNNHY